MKNQIKLLIISFSLVVFVASNSALTNGNEGSNQLLQKSDSKTSVLLPQNPMGGHKDGNGKSRGNR